MSYSASKRLPRSSPLKLLFLHGNGGSAFLAENFQIPGLVQGLIKANQWCHVPVGARQAWDFALVDTELNGEAATAVYRLDGAPARKPLMSITNA